MFVPVNVVVQRDTVVEILATGLAQIFLPIPVNPCFVDFHEMFVTRRVRVEGHFAFRTFVALSLLVPAFYVAPHRTGLQRHSTEMAHDTRLLVLILLFTDRFVYFLGIRRLLRVFELRSIRILSWFAFMIRKC